MFPDNVKEILVSSEYDEEEFWINTLEKFIYRDILRIFLQTVNSTVDFAYFFAVQQLQQQKCRVFAKKMQSSAKLLAENV